MIVAGLGFGGTLVGSAQALKSRKPLLEIVGVEPAEAPMISQGEYRPHRIMGTSPGFVPGILKKDDSSIDRIELVDDETAFQHGRLLASEEGILAGISSGAVVAACLRLAGEPGSKGN